MSVGTAEIIDYYNNMLPYMEKYHRGINDGRLKAINNFLSNIVKPDMKVLDVGCGTGITSKHMAQLGAKVTAVDIAPLLIEYAKTHSKHENITYIVEDIGNFLVNERFDIIVFVDVFEHIVPDNIFMVVRRLTKHNTHEGSKIYLNIPDSNFLKYMKINHPDKLQIIDHDHAKGDILSLFEYCDFIPVHMKIYGIDVDVQYNEYLFITKKKLNHYYEISCCI